MSLMGGDNLCFHIHSVFGLECRLIEKCLSLCQLLSWYSTQSVKCTTERERERRSIIRQICGHLCELRYQSWAFLAVIQPLVNCAERTTQGNV